MPPKQKTPLLKVGLETDHTKSASPSTVDSRLLAFQFNDASLATARCARWNTCFQVGLGQFSFTSLSCSLFFCPLALQQPSSVAMGPSAGATIPRRALLAFLFLALCPTSTICTLDHAPPSILCGASFHFSILTHL